MTGYVYAIGMESTQYVKIGHARSPEKRLAALQSGLPFKLELLYVLKVKEPRTVERALHLLLAESQVRGEWFELPERPWPELFARAAAQAKPAPPQRIAWRPSAQTRQELEAILNGEEPMNDGELREWLRANILEPWVLPSTTPSGRQPPNSLARNVRSLLAGIIDGSFKLPETDFRLWLWNVFLLERRHRAEVGHG